MRILIVSDTHRRNDTFKKVIETEEAFDMVIHCGDAEGDEDLLKQMAGCPMEIVLGNNDFFSDLPREIEIPIGKYKVWITHGHNYYISMGNEMLKTEAKARGMDIVMYGHTHKPVVEIQTDMIAINPGSLTYPRQEEKRPSYVVMEMEEGAEAKFSIFYL